MKKILSKIVCKIFGHIYPLKKLPTPDYLKKMFPKEFKNSKVGAYIADTSKPCHRCGEKK